jgi:hypothetical protein
MLVDGEYWKVCDTWDDPVEFVTHSPIVRGDEASASGSN